MNIYNRIFHVCEFEKFTWKNKSFIIFKNTFQELGLASQFYFGPESEIKYSLPVLRCALLNARTVAN